MKRLLIAIISFILLLIYAIPNAALMFGVILTIYSKWVSGVFTFIFAFNIAKLVESKYKKYLEKDNLSKGAEYEGDE